MQTFFMQTAIIGIGNIGSRVAGDLVAGEERIIVSGKNDADAQALAKKLGPLAKASTAAAAISEADAIVFAVWFDVMKALITQYARNLVGKVVLDPSNPIRLDPERGFLRTLPDGQSAGAIIASLLPAGAHYVKAFGTMGAESLEKYSRRQPERAVLFYATDDGFAAQTAERLITSAGFDPVRAGGVDAAIRIEAFGDLHDMGGLNGRVVSKTEANALLQRDAKG